MDACFAPMSRRELLGALGGAIPDGELVAGARDARRHGTPDRAQAKEGCVHANKTTPPLSFPHDHPRPHRRYELPALRPRRLHGAGPRVEGITRADVSIGAIEVEHDGRVTAEQLREAIAVAGYSVGEVETGSASVADRVGATELPITDKDGH